MGHEKGQVFSGGSKTHNMYKQTFYNYIITTMNPFLMSSDHTMCKLGTYAAERKSVVLFAFNISSIYTRNYNKGISEKV